MGAHFHEKGQMNSKDTAHASHSMPDLADADPQTARALRISAWLTGVYFVIELTIGLYSGSIAVISDAFHTFSAVGGVVLAIAARRIARRPADIKRTFGSYRAEIVGALLNGIFLLVMALIVLAMGYMRLREPIELPTTPMLIAAAGGLATELVSLWLLYGNQKSDLNLRGAFWHVMQTFVGSLLIILAALVIIFTGFTPIDPILGMAFGVVLLIASWGIIRDAIYILMEGTPRDINLGAVVSTLSELPNVQDVHHVHAWTLTSNKNVFSAHLRIATSEGETELLRNAHDLLREKFGFAFSTLQLETGCLDESAADEFNVNIGGGS
jgi:cobalt-zinc-cadmium efflux system protein